MATTETEKQAINLQKGIEAAKVAKKLRAQHIRATIACLKQTFPLAFSDTCVPLKCHVFQDIVTYWQRHETEMGTLSKKLLRDTLQFYTSRLAYHQACLLDNATRVDLTGMPIEPVTDEAKVHHQHCADKITALHLKRAAKREKQNKVVEVTEAMAEAAITTDADGRPVLTLKKKS